MCRIQVLKRGRWDFFSALPHDYPFLKTISKPFSIYSNPLCL